MRTIFKFGNEEAMARFIAELIKQSIVFTSVEVGCEYVITYTGGY